MSIRTVLAFLIALALMGCASITGSKNQPVSVTAICNGAPAKDASCVLVNDKGTWYVTAPGSVVVGKSTSDLSVTCSTANSRTSAAFQSRSNPGVWGNILAGGVIGYAVDSSTGAGFDYPPTMTVILSGQCGPAPADPISNPAKSAFEVKLQGLKKLREKDLITDEEFQQKRKALIEQL